MNSNIYPRSNDFQTIYLNTVIKNPAIIVGDYTIYNICLLYTSHSNENFFSLR